MRNLTLVLVLAFTGCTSNLQRAYVDSMVATHKAIVADVDAGFYKPDDAGKATLAEWKKANDDALEVLAQQEGE